MIWFFRAVTVLMFLGSLALAGLAAFHFRSVGFTVTMLAMAAIIGYMSLTDVRKIIAERAKK